MGLPVSIRKKLTRLKNSGGSGSGSGCQCCAGCCPNVPQHTEQSGEPQPIEYAPTLLLTVTDSDPGCPNWPFDEVALNYYFDETDVGPAVLEPGDFWRGWVGYVEVPAQFPLAHREYYYFEFSCFGPDGYILTVHKWYEGLTSEVASGFDSQFTWSTTVKQRSCNPFSVRYPMPDSAEFESCMISTPIPTFSNEPPLLDFICEVPSGPGSDSGGGSGVDRVRCFWHWGCEVTEMPDP